MAIQMSSREFNQDTSGAKRAASNGPVYVTDRGRPAHVLLSYEQYEELLGAGNVIERLGEPAGVEDVELPIPSLRDQARPAGFE